MAATGTETEDELLAHCRAGDQDAFRRLVELHHQRVYRTAFALTADPADAAEVTQEVFVNAWRGLPRFRGDAAVATWLTRLALNAARDHLRRRRTRDLAQAARDAFGLPWGAGEDAVRAVEDRDELDQALRHLSPQARQIVALRYGLDLSLKEIAQTLDCPEGTVKSRLNAALAQLRRIIGQGRAAVG